MIPTGFDFRGGPLRYAENYGLKSSNEMDGSATLGEICPCDFLSARPEWNYIL
jgi:hypothetical protein